MKKQYISACLAGIATLGLSGAAMATDTDPVVFNNSTADSGQGNQSGFILGMDFSVACPTVVSSLGTFDNNLYTTSNPGGSGSISGSLSDLYNTSGEHTDIQVAIYNVATGTLVTPIVNFTYANAASYYALGSSIFQTISPVTLPVGNYMIAAAGYFYENTAAGAGVSGGFESGNTLKAPNSTPAPTFSTLGGYLTLGLANYGGPGGDGGVPLPNPNINGSVMLDGTLPPESPTTGPQYLAGTFQATCNCTAPDGGTTLGLLGVAFAGIAGLSRKFKR